MQTIETPMSIRVSIQNNVYAPPNNLLTSKKRGLQINIYALRILIKKNRYGSFSRKKSTEN